MDSKKRKIDYSKSATGKKKRRVCIIHSLGCSYNEAFTYICDVENPNERFQMIQSIAEKRKNMPMTSSQSLNQLCQARIPESYSAEHGYHRWCYKRFTKNLDRLKSCAESDAPDEPSSSMIREERTDKRDRVIFNPDCIFCRKEGYKKIKQKGVWTTEKLSMFEFDGWKTILQIAEHNSDESLLTRIRGHDLFASEAKYHRSCLRVYSSKPAYWRSISGEEREKQNKLEKAHSFAFKKVDENILQNLHIVKLTDLQEIYVKALEVTEFPNKQYRCEKLKQKIEKTPAYAENVGFCCVDKPGRFSSYLVYNAHSGIDQAIKYSYRLGNIDQIAETAIYLRGIILGAFNNSEDMPWPPSDEFLSKNDVLPEKLQSFLAYIISGKVDMQSKKTNRLVLSIGQDICRAVTNAQWKLPKHVLICMTLRHLFRNKDLLTLINRLGYSEGHCFSLELETAIAIAVQECSDMLSSKIVRNPLCPSVFHSEFDNFDQLVNDVSGHGSIHTAHGIMLQEVTKKDGGICPVLVTTDRQKKRSWVELSGEQIPDCYVAHRKSPVMNIKYKSVPGSENAYYNAKKKDVAWLLLRHFQTSNQNVPGWAGFVSSSGLEPRNLTTIDYYPVIYQPITQYSTVQECLRYAEEATNEVGQKYVYSTGDLGVCMKAYTLLWNNPERFSRHIFLIGTFHLIMGYYKVIGKKMDGSGILMFFWRLT